MSYLVTGGLGGFGLALAALAGQAPARATSPSPPSGARTCLLTHLACPQPTLRERHMTNALLQAVRTPALVRGLPSAYP